MMKEEARVDHPRETGGVLIGVLAGSRPWVTHAVHVPSPRSSGTSYEIPAGARRRAVDRARCFDQRVGYLGDWHSHPVDVEPSERDATTMKRVAVDPYAECSMPLLLVLRRVGDDYWVDARQWRGRSLQSLQVLRAGPLSSGGPLRPRRWRRLRTITKTVRGGR